MGHSVTFFIKQRLLACYPYGTPWMKSPTPWLHASNKQACFVLPMRVDPFACCQVQAKDSKLHAGSTKPRILFGLTPSPKDLSSFCTEIYM